jgi:hypothetical protein
VTRRWVLLLVGGLLSAVVVGLLGVVGMARAGDCVVARHDPLTVDRLIAVKERFEDYRSHPDQHPLSISGDEIAMLIEDRADVPVFLELDDAYVQGRAAIPAWGGGCWDVGFHGRMTIDDGAAVLVPDRLTVGRLDLTWWMAGRPLELQPDQLPRRLGKFVAQLRHGEIRHGHMFVDLVSPESFRWR